MSSLLVALAWILWCTLHSLLITTAVSNWIKEKDGWYAGLYRLAYNLFAAISLLPVLWLQYRLPQEVLCIWHGPWRLLQAGLILYAVIMFWSGARVYALDHFLGLAQYRAYRGKTRQADPPFRQQGILCYVRHPWYSGGIAFLLALEPITDLSLISRSILIIYLLLGMVLEEKKLIREIGPRYEQYRSQVPPLIPWKGKVVVK